MDNIYTNSDIPSFHLEDRQDDEFFKAKKRSAPRRYPLALLAVLCIALLGSVIALVVLNKQNSNRSNSLEEENSKLSVSLSAMKEQLGDCRSENVSFHSGMKLRVTGVPKPNPVRYSIDVGHSAQMLALHFDLRFNYNGDYRVIVLNSFHNSKWKEEQREYNFPFEAEQEFEITISVTSENFFINLAAGNTINFPNRLGDERYDFLSLGGDVEVKSISLR